VGEVIPLHSPDRHKGKTLCRNGHHRWKIWQPKQFDTRSGRLVTVYRCERCGEQKVKAL